MVELVLKLVLLSAFSDLSSSLFLKQRNDLSFRVVRFLLATFLDFLMFELLNSFLLCVFELYAVLSC